MGRRAAVARLFVHKKVYVGIKNPIYTEAGLVIKYTSRL